ncbi:aldehyde dehydrogenase family protein, partial [Bosea sp. (in: a-proteobacteria)]|uniref:aldehyde dehydrogenase family protein n=1 Tax=Bosea sp. (in: a-proteobacteria) TaxID=1871050 RepID=UPI0031FEC7B7
MSVQRVLADRAVAHELAERLAATAATLKVGDPTLPNTEVGPMIRHGELQRVEHDRRRRRLGQLEVRGPQAAQGVLGLAPQEFRLQRGRAVDGDDLDRVRQTEESLGELADFDELLAHRVHHAVALEARGDVVRQLIEMRLVGVDQLVTAGGDHPAEHALQQVEVEGFSLFEEGLDPRGQERRHFPGEDRQSGL